MVFVLASFTPIASLVGGLLIGLAAAVLVLFNGRIAGISGVVAALVGPNAEPARWRWAFVAGLALAPALWWATIGAVPAGSPSASPIVLVVAGLFVGIGTRVGAGCTSGHGVCGLSRFSARSLVATLVFMAVGVITAIVTRHHG